MKGAKRVARAHKLGARYVPSKANENRVDYCRAQILHTCHDTKSWLSREVSGMRAFIRITPTQLLQKFLELKRATNDTATQKSA